jgi:hypothetical protein
MSDFERHLVGGLPLVDAAAFFIGVKNHGWPDTAEETFNKCAARPKTEKERRTLALSAGVGGTIGISAAEALDVRRKLLNKYKSRMKDLSPDEAKRLKGVMTRGSLVRGARVGVPLGVLGGLGFYALNKPKPEPKAKTAAAKQSDAQQVIADLLAGKKLAGKAGYVKTAADKSDAELREAGRQRAVTSMAAEAHREKGRRGERAGETIGRVVGAVGGAGVGGKFLGKKLGPIAGMAAGYGIGGKAGKEIGTESDIRKAAAAMRFKLAQGEMVPQQENLAAQTEPEAAPASILQNPPKPAAAPQQPQAPQQPPTVPTNYMGAEMLAQQSQQENEANFYRERLGKAVADNQAMTQELQTIQQSVAGLQDQAAASGEQIAAATAEAVQASDRAMQHSQEAARMRMGMQQLREQMLQVASQDPDAIVQQDQAVQQEQANEQAALAGTPEASPAPGGGAPPGTPAAGAPQPGGGVQAPAGGDTTPSAEKPMQQDTKSPEDGKKETKTTTTTKVAALPKGLTSRLPYAAGGAGLGLLSVAATRKGVPELKERVQNLEGEQGGFGKAVEMARAKLELAMAEEAQASPGRAALKGALVGAAGMSAIGPGLVGQAARMTGV